MTNASPASNRTSGDGAAGRRVTPALLLMAAIGVVVAALGAAQLMRGGRAGRAGRESAAYRERLAGVMLVALGFILIVFAVTYMTVTRS